MEAEDEGWDPVKLAQARPLPLALPTSNSLLTVPRRYFHCGSFC